MKKFILGVLVLFWPQIAAAQITGGNFLVQGIVAHDATYTGNPIPLGCYASAAAPADVSADGDVAHVWCLRNGSISVTFTNASIATGSLTDTELRATPVPVSGTFWQATQPVSGTVTANQGGTWTVQPGNTANSTAWLVTGTGGTFPVTGTFWQATQPVSLADGSDVTLGAKADAKSTATDTTAVSIMSVLKEISAMEQAPASRAVTNAGTFATQSAITAASGAYAAGSISDGADVTLGAKADAKSTATDTTAVTAMQVLKEISFMLQNPAALPANQSVDVARVAGAAVGQTNPLPVVFPGTLVSGAVTSAMTGTTSTSVVGGTGSNYLYITNCVVSNGSTTVSTDINLQDGSGGTTLYVLPAPAATTATTGGGGSVVPFPVPLKVPTSGNALYAANVTTGSSTKISCSGFRSTVSY